MSNNQEPQNQAMPILRLRPVVPTELIRPGQQGKQPDGPWIAHPGLIDEEINLPLRTGIFEPDISKDDYRVLWKEHHVQALEELKGQKIEDLEIISVINLSPSVDMRNINGMTDHEIALAVERYYVGAHQYGISYSKFVIIGYDTDLARYLLHDSFVPPSLIERFGPEWGMNARGIYYRHYYSSGWVTADHSLWLPSLDSKDWDHPAEESRRARARIFLKHVLDNEKWNKSEYAWEADAWTDVFGLMRNDPLLAIDKHEYNTVGRKIHPVSCLLTGESKFIKRIPDATFGLATFEPKDYQSVLAEWDLDRDRLEALLLNRYCGLISDPRWGDINLIFPFAVYEAKGWSGDSREARRQACSAGAVYLDMLDNLTRQPGKTGKKSGAYQTAQSRSSQVFVFTSFGAHWHILVGYKRPRLKRENAGREGLSEFVYVFQRIWSCRVVTERKAWELLSFVDQIHLWGVTDFREFVIQHLKPWHEFRKKCDVNDVKLIDMILGTGNANVNGPCIIPSPRLLLPEWTKYVTEDTRLKLQKRAAFHIREAYSKYRRDIRAKSDEFPDMLSCQIGECGRLGGLGYPLASREEVVIHLREIHGVNDAEIARYRSTWERGDWLRPPTLSSGVTDGGMLPSSGVMDRKGRTPPLEDTANNVNASKRIKR